jgi:hypothetical protein
MPSFSSSALRRRAALLLSTLSTSSPQRLSSATSSLLRLPLRHVSYPAILPRSNADGVYNEHVLPSNVPSTRKRNEKTPMEFIAQVPPIEVEGNTAVCDGGPSPSQRSAHPGV